MKIILILVLLFVTIVLGSCDNRSAKQRQGQDVTNIVNNRGTDSVDSAKSESRAMHKRIDAKFEGVYDTFDEDFRDLEDSLKSILFNLTVSFCGDTIIINGNPKAIFT